MDDLLLGHIACMQCRNQPIVTSVLWSVCVCVCLLVTTMSCAKMAEQIKMLLGLWTWVAPRNHVLGVGLDSPGGRGKFGGHFPVHCIRNIWHEPELFARARCMQ